MIEQVNHFFLHPSPAQNLRWSLADWRISKPLNLSHKSCQSSLSPSLFSPVLTLGLPLLSPGEPLLGTLRNPIFSAGLTVPYLCPEATNPVSKTPLTSSELLLQLRLVRSTWWPMLYSKRPLLKYELIFFASITFVYFYFNNQIVDFLKSNHNWLIYVSCKALHRAWPRPTVFGNL